MINQLKFNDLKIEKKEFNSSNEAIHVNKVDIEELLISHESVNGKNKEADTKYFIGYKTGKNCGLLFITLPQMTGYPSKV